MYKVGTKVLFKRNKIEATVVDIKTEGQPYKLKFADGGCIWASANSVENIDNPWLRRKKARTARPIVDSDLWCIHTPCISSHYNYIVPSTIVWEPETNEK